MKFQTAINSYISITLQNPDRINGITNYNIRVMKKTTKDHNKGVLTIKDKLILPNYTTTIKKYKAEKEAAHYITGRALNYIKTGNINDEAFFRKMNQIMCEDEMILIHASTSIE